MIFFGRQFFLAVGGQIFFGRGVSDARGNEGQKFWPWDFFFSREARQGQKHWKNFGREAPFFLPKIGQGQKFLKYFGREISYFQCKFFRAKNYFFSRPKKTVALRPFWRDEKWTAFYGYEEGVGTD